MPLSRVEHAARRRATILVPRALVGRSATEEAERAGRRSLGAAGREIVARSRAPSLAGVAIGVDPAISPETSVRIELRDSARAHAGAAVVVVGAFVVRARPRRAHDDAAPVLAGIAVCVSRARSTDAGHDEAHATLRGARARRRAMRRWRLRLVNRELAKRSCVTARATEEGESDDAQAHTRRLRPLSNATSILPSSRARTTPSPNFE